MGSLEKGECLIQIITPVFAEDNVLKETFEAINAQTFRDFEWLIVNDGPTNSVASGIIEDFEKTTDWIKVIHHPENKGLPAARNTGIKNSTSPYLFFLDADDLIDPTFLEKAYLVLQTNPEFAFANSYVIGFGAQDYKWHGGFHENELFLKENRNTSCFMARREVFDQVLFDETMKTGCEDWDFWLHAATKGFWGYTIPEYLFYYRRSAENKWATLEGQHSLQQIQTQLSEKYAAKLKTDFPKVQQQTYSFGFKSPEIEKPTNVNLKKNRHLLCIFPWLQIGGADQYNYNLLKGLKNKGWSFTIITTLPNEHPWEAKFRELTPDVFHLANLTAEKQHLSLLQYLISTRQPEFVFLSNSMFGYYALPFIKQNFPDLPVTDYVHCEEIGWYNGGYPYFSAVYTKLLDKTFTTSGNLKNWCIANGSDPSKVEVCYINVDTKSINRNDEKRNEIRDQLQISEQTALLLYVARLTEQKQPDVLIETLSSLKTKGSDFKCLIIGDGPDREKMLQLIEKRKLQESVIYLGSQPNEKVMQYMDVADIFFLPSKYEGIALSVYEAMAKELVIVGANVGGQAELVTTDCGFLISNSTFSDTIQAYTSVLQNLIADPELVKKSGKQGKAKVEQSFDLALMVEQMHSAFLNLATKPSPALPAEALPEAYALLLNRMMHLEKDNEYLWHRSNSRAVRIIYKYKKPYQRLKQVYQKVKNVVRN